MNLSSSSPGRIARIPVIGGYLSAWRRVFDVRGRSTRSEHWSFVWGCLLLLMLAWAVSEAVEPETWERMSHAVTLCIVAHRLPYLTLLARRLLDAGLPRILCLLIFVPDLTLWWVENTWEFPDTDGGVAMMLVGSVAASVFAVQLLVGLMPSAAAEPSQPDGMPQPA